ncbi:SCAF11 isoform X1 [Pelobates cultripes]|uniref:SCAF11 isoform X1 n=1 Tax=Pelobates cultripes TaxID=61616 RepID=A0AAD1RTS3_PELCU|nr:SCAF11 isoform X1 [Pelobates cultripes]
MQNKHLYSSGADEQSPTENDGEDNKDVNQTLVTAPNPSERCPICLNFLTQDVGFPENCYHAFCVNCILKWSETSTSCPVDRKPFQVVYKITPADGCTKIKVKARRPRERCCCNGNQRYSFCCVKAKFRYRMDANKEFSNRNAQLSKLENNRCITMKEKPESEMEFKMLSLTEHCNTSDFMDVCPLDGLPGLPHVSICDLSEDGENDLIQQKRAGLKYLRPAVVRKSEYHVSLSAAIEALTPSVATSILDEYVPPLCSPSIRNQGFSTRKCVNSSAQDGTEKKAASGASNGRGSRRKAPQTSTRRRSTRNSKSEDLSQLPSSPKSSNSDRDTGCNNNSSASVSSAGHSVKTPTKPRKRAPKKRSQTRKRLKSTTQTQEESSGSKENSADESEPELEKKRKVSGDSLLEMADSDIESSSTHNVEKIPEHMDSQPSPCVSPVQTQSEDEMGPLSPRAQTAYSSDEKCSFPVSQDEQESDLEDFASSSFLKNDHCSKEVRSPASTASEKQSDSENDPLPKSVVCKSSLNSEGEESSDCKKPVSSEGDDSSSPAPEEHQHSDNLEPPDFSPARRKYEFYKEDSASSPASVKQLDSDRVNSSPKSSPESKGSDSPPLDDDDVISKEECSVESSLEGYKSECTEPNDLPDSKNGHLSPHLPSSENEVMSSKDEETLFPDKGKLSDLADSPASVCENDVPISEMQTGERAAQEDSCLSNENNSVSEEANGLSANVQNTELKESVEGKETTIVPEECNKCSPEMQSATPALQHSQSDVINSSSKEGFHDANKNEVEPSAIPVDVIGNTNSQASFTLSNIDTDSGIPHVQNNEQPKVFCEEDNNESVEMECESDSDDNGSEIEQQKEINKINSSESNAEVHVQKEELKPQTTNVPLGVDEKSDEMKSKESRPRRSRFHSPSTTWSPQKTDVRERPRSRSRGTDSPGKRRSRSRSRDRDGNRDHGGQWKGRSRGRWHRRQSRSKSKSRSRSRSPSRSMGRNKCPPPDRNEADCSSPPWRERRQYDNWKSPRGNERYRRNEQEKTDSFRRERHEMSRESSESYQDNSNQNDYPDWVVEKMKSVETRGQGSHRSRVSPRGSQWDSNNYNAGDSWTKATNMDWKSPRGRGGFRGGFGYGDQTENRWNNRQPFSGNSNSSGHESSRFNEQRNYKPKYEQEQFDSPADRSGWSSASSWAVRKTLPADVQNYYSKRGKAPTGSQPVWPRQEETTDQALKIDQPIKDQVSQPTESPQMPVNLMPPQMNVVQQQINPPPIQPMNMFPYSVNVPPPPMVNMQHNPYSIHPQLPMHIHPGLPIVQVSASTSVSQGLPPPPPPPPPSQQVSYVASQQEGKPPQGNPGASHVSNNFIAPVLPAPTAALVAGTAMGPNSGSVASSTHSKAPHTSIKPPARKEIITVEATADSSKKEKVYFLLALLHVSFFNLVFFFFHLFPCHKTKEVFIL